MKEVINHSTYTHLLNTIKSILTQTLKKLCKKKVYGKKTLTTCISETKQTNSLRDLSVKQKYKIAYII